ncbi:hypothetical protein AVEN_243194-1 [Araneus ventricosus]|uniref:Uncharacterized protein n=1 Tax=Araneus ventricosus TaxID=182803 RepID=A0A4Y2F1E0_ARAVE|nr:hypothetical protein AVEN_243194-1 [Araneus ventricosus]
MSSLNLPLSVRESLGEITPADLTCPCGTESRNWETGSVFSSQLIWHREGQGPHHRRRGRGDEHRLPPSSPRDERRPPAREVRTRAGR